MVDQTPYYATPADPLIAGHRVEDWWVELVSRDGSDLGRLDGVGGGQIDQNVDATIGGGGHLIVDDLDANAVDWLNTRVQPWWSIAGADPFPLGVFLTSAPEKSRADGRGTWFVELADKTQVLEADKVVDAYSLAAGTVVTDAVETLIVSTGESAASLAITASTETLTVGMVWEPGTSKLRIVNDLLATINYFALWCDGYGRFVAEPYVRPQDRALAWSFEDGPTAVHEDSLRRLENLSEVPNRFILVSLATLDAEALTAVAEDTTSARFSYAARGNRWITETETDIEVTSQAVLDAKCERMLAAAQSVAATGELRTAVIPLELNDAVEVATGGVDHARASVRRITRFLEVGRTQRVIVREVVS